MKKQLQKRQEDISAVKKQTDRLEEELERQRVFARGENIVFYGIPEVVPDRESEDDCASTLVNSLNSHDEGRKWAMEAIAQAHRLGRKQKNQIRPRPVIAKFVKSRDKRDLIANRSVCKKLVKADIRMNDDLTPKQRSTLKDLRDDGYTAFYRGTKLFSKRRRQPDQQATAVVSSMDSDDEAQFDDDDEVYRGGCGAVEDPTYSPARRSLNFNDSNGRPRSMAADEDANSTADRTRP